MPNPNGSALPITLVAVPGRAPFELKEGSSFLPNPNPNFPGLFFGFSTDFITPDGTVIPATANLAALFQFAGVEISEQGPILSTFFWFVGGSFPPTATEVIMGARIMDKDGVWSPFAFRRISVLRGRSGDSLTPNP